MSISQKFKTSAEFVLYVEEAFGIGFVDAKLEVFYNENQNFKFTYTGLLKALKSL